MTWEPTVSPTQIDDWHLCERYWGFRTLVKGQYVQNIGAFRGEWGHKMLEAWGRTHTPPENLANDFALEVALQFPKDLDDKRISGTDYAARLVDTVNKMTPFLPEPPFEQHGARVEGDFRVRIDGVLWSGRKDLETHAEVWDYKFTSAPEFAKTADQLPTDPQALTYAFDKMWREKLPSVTVKLLYGHVCAKPRAWVVAHTFTPQEIVVGIEPHNEIAKNLVRLRRNRTDPYSLTPNWRACTHHGEAGCPFQSKCKPTAAQLLEAHAATAFGESTGKESAMSDLLSSLMGPSSAQSGASHALPGANAVPVPTTPTAERSDTAGPMSECSKDAAKLLNLQVPFEAVVSSMKNRYVGLDPAVVEALCSAANTPQTTAAPATTPPVQTTIMPTNPINSGGAPAVAPKVEEKAPEQDKPKTTRKTAAKEGTTIALDMAPVFEHVRTLILQCGNAEQAANAALALVQAFKAL